MRLRFYGTLKGIYKDAYDKGNCQSYSLVLLKEAVTRAIEEENVPLNDWEYIEPQLLSDKTAKFLKYFTRFPVIGRLFRWNLFIQISRIFDIITNFEEGHRLTYEFLKHIIKRKDVLDVVKKESRK
mmetsp:Transcript_35336/g.26341  ORF Transcript_35336/g.26341 Transcript_35336/m.26341 type:complete len:126 (+) Transcript_35336:906-1283(+)|eukprot:CAMPEP_0202968044 /NCGR_PEP_ID=MMETSP1396-20130829/13153_1 /ASSEMBLY_ACC=CAM_ASM_000872 /TAXON_ID= /ORGANISM="Pseudokeronopsis sp., Strain Brazil" /LENGTH=125 /DNA_ID=CAMNT_0049693863 /DNA_START=515 /DNA_END=892 /DNA_ORIENTATION=+